MDKSILGNIVRYLPEQESISDLFYRDSSPKFENSKNIFVKLSLFHSRYSAAVQNFRLSKNKAPEKIFPVSALK